MHSSKRLVLIAMVAPLLLAACGSVGVTAPSDTSPEPPRDSAEGVVAIGTARGRAAAELLAQPTDVGRGDRVVLRVANRGELRLGFGRPIRVERWDGREWVETDESRQAAWTMELLLLEPNQIGVEQRWPFMPGAQPQPGWYRFTKQIHVEDASNQPERFTVMARVRVVDR